MGIIQNLKLNRALDPDAEKAQYNSTISTADRLAEEQDFDNYIRQKNPSITAPEAYSLWNAYNTQMPPYDFTTLKTLPKNKGQWKKYASPEAVSTLRETGAFNPSQQEETQLQQSPPTTSIAAIKQGAQTFKNMMIKMKGIDPKDGTMKIWNVPQGKAQKFLDNGFVRAY